MWVLALLIVALVLFILAALGVTERYRLGWAGLAFLTGAFIVERL